MQGKLLKCTEALPWSCNIALVGMSIIVFVFNMSMWKYKKKNTFQNYYTEYKVSIQGSTHITVPHGGENSLCCK